MDSMDCHKKVPQDQSRKKVVVQDAVKRRIPWCSVRWTMGYMATLMKVMVNIFNINMAITLPFMVSIRGNGSTTGSNESLNQFNTSGQYLGEGNQMPSVLWDKTEQCLVLSSYFVGYLVTQIPAGWAIKRFGWKHVITAAMGVSTVLTMVIPVSARASVYAVIGIRILLGASAGVTVPAILDLVSCWALPSERNKFTYMLWIGQSFGIFIGYVTAGVLCAYGFDGGWGSVYYIQGAMGVVFVVVWIVCVADSPENHPRISGAERHLLTNNKPGLQLCTNVSNVPLQRMLTSVPVWSVFFTHMFDNFTYCLILLYMPMFLSEVMDLHILTNGLLSALPIIFSGVGFVVAGCFSDFLISKRKTFGATTRKLFGIVGLCCGGVFVMVPGYLTCDQRTLVTFCFCCCMLFLGISQGAGYTRNPDTMAPRYANSIRVISSTLAALPVIITPIVIEELSRNGPVAEWRVVFDSAAVCSLLAAVAYGMFSSYDLEWWARSRPGEPCAKVEDDRYSLVNGLFHPDEMWP